MIQDWPMIPLVWVGVCLFDKTLSQVAPSAFDCLCMGQQYCYLRTIVFAPNCDNLVPVSYLRTSSLWVRIRRVDARFIEFTISIMIRQAIRWCCIKYLEFSYHYVVVVERDYLRMDIIIIFIMSFNLQNLFHPIPRLINHH